MERAGYIFRHNGEPFRGKVGGPLVVPGSNHWSVAFGRNKGEVANDKEGMKAAWDLARMLLGWYKDSMGSSLA